MNLKKNNRIVAGLAAVTTLTVTLAAMAAPASASDLSKALGLDNNKNGASARQTDKNNMRNLGIGLGAVAAYQLLKGNTTTGLVLGAGAAYAAKKYEDERKAQAKDDRWDDHNRRVYRYRNGERIGYDEYRDGKRVSYWERQHDGKGWSDRYVKSRDY